MPLQLPFLPAQVQLQHLAVALQTAVGTRHDFNRLVAVPHQSIAGQPHTVALTRLVEAPVFRDAQGRIGGRLLLDIGPAGGGRGHLQHEVGRLALLGDYVGVAVVIGLRVDIEGDQQVGHAQPLGASPGFRHDVQFPANQGGLGIAEMQAQVVGAAGVGEVSEAAHLVGMSRRRVRKRHQEASVHPGRAEGCGAHIASG